MTQNTQSTSIRKRTLKHSPRKPKPNRFYYDSDTLSHLSPKTRAQFMRLKNKASRRQSKKENDNRDTVFSKQVALRDMMPSSRTTRKKSGKSSVNKPSLYVIRETSSPFLYTNNLSELSPNTRDLFVQHKKMAKTRIQSDKNRGLSKYRSRTKRKHKRRGYKNKV